jgi:hypothetical protein
MAACRLQRIASLDYLVTFPSGVAAPAPDKIRAGFAGHPPPTGEGVRVDLVAGEMPDLGSWRMLAASGPAWRIWQRDTQRCLRLGQPREDRPVQLVVCWQGDASRAILYCDPARITPGNAVALADAAGYPVDQVLLMYYLARRRGLLVHAAGLAADGRALIFPGVSGAGKSTLARQFLACKFLGGGRWGLLSDDRIIVREIDGRPIAFGTPWPGEAGVAENAGAPLAAILFPARGKDTRIRELSPQAALDRLLPAASMLWFEPELLSSQLETCERLLRDVPAFELSWSPGTGVVEDVREFVSRM